MYFLRKVIYDEEERQFLKYVGYGRELRGRLGVREVIFVFIL